MITKLFNFLKQHQVSHQIARQLGQDILSKDIVPHQSQKPLSRQCPSKKKQNVEQSTLSPDIKVKKPRAKKVKEIPLSPFDESLKILGYLGASALVFSLAYFKDEQAKENLHSLKETNKETEESTMEAIDANKDANMHSIKKTLRITTPIHSKLP